MIGKAHSFNNTFLLCCLIWQLIQLLLCRSSQNNRILSHLPASVYAYNPLMKSLARCRLLLHHTGGYRQVLPIPPAIFATAE